MSKQQYGIDRKGSDAEGGPWAALRESAVTLTLVNNNQESPTHW